MVMKAEELTPKKPVAPIDYTKDLSCPMIGIFDSGVGGLTVARAVLDQLPHEPIRYVGDTARGPYGPRPLAEVRSFSLEIMDHLVEHGVVAAVHHEVGDVLAPVRAQHLEVEALEMQILAAPREDYTKRLLAAIPRGYRAAA